MLPNHQDYVCSAEQLAAGTGITVKKSLAIGYLPAKFAEVGTRLSNPILGKAKKATMLRESPHGLGYLGLRA
jgi:glycine cleavage system aminomethyltransferase T